MLFLDPGIASLLFQLLFLGLFAAPVVALIVAVIRWLNRHESMYAEKGSSEKMCSIELR